MNTLCLSTNLTSTEMAAWVQAIGSIIAIGIALLIAGWQSRRQLKNALLLQTNENLLKTIDQGNTLLILAENSNKLITHLRKEIKDDRSNVHKIANQEKYFDMGELIRLDTVIARISIHHLPSAFVTPTMMLSGTVRQFREKIESVISNYRQMDGSSFQDFFDTMQKMNESLSATCLDYEKEIKNIKMIKST